MSHVKRLNGGTRLGGGAQRRRWSRFYGHRSVWRRNDFLTYLLSRLRGLWDFLFFSLLCMGARVGDKAIAERPRKFIFSRRFSLNDSPKCYRYQMPCNNLRGPFTPK